MRGARFSSCLAGLLLGILCLPGQSLGGAIKGKVVFVGAAPAPVKIDITIDQYLCGNQKDTEDLLLSPQKEIRNAVVWLENAPAGAAWPAQTEKVEMDQKGCVFIPHVVVVPAGGTVDFLNSDRLLHNIRAAPKLNASFSRTQTKGRTVPIAFAKPEIVRVSCDLHSWMAGWVVVAPHSYYVVTGPDGQFVFDEVPPGKYKLMTWHERLGTVPAIVFVSDQQPARVTIEMKAP